MKYFKWIVHKHKWECICNIWLTSHLYEASRVETLPGGIHGTLVFTLAVGCKPLFVLTWNIKDIEGARWVLWNFGCFLCCTLLWICVNYYKFKCILRMGFNAKVIRWCYTWAVLVGLHFVLFFTCTCTGVVSFTCTCRGGEEELVLDFFCIKKDKQQ